MSASALTADRLDALLLQDGSPVHLALEHVRGGAVGEALREEVLQAFRRVVLLVEEEPEVEQRREEFLADEDLRELALRVRGPPELIPGGCA